MHEDFDIPDRRQSGRRATDAEAFNLMVETREIVEQLESHIAQKFAEVHKEQREYSEASEKRHAEITRRLETMSQSTVNAISKQNEMVNEIHKLFKIAFPEGDAESHRRAHEAWIEKSKREEEFWIGIKKQAVGAAVVALMGFVTLAVWVAVLKGPGA